MNKLLNLEFPKGAQTVYVDGKRYTKKAFQSAIDKIKSQDTDGRFFKNVNEGW
ncbi:hypothetical protein OA501_02435 [Flavobacteriaceae bacterium]|nr:hypothetical protein [Flavobacteriaceae bacterium]